MATKSNSSIEAAEIVVGVASSGKSVENNWR